MSGEVSPAGDLLAAEEALIVVIEVFGIEMLRKQGLAREVGVARMAPVGLHAVADDVYDHVIARCQNMVCLH